MEWRSFLLNLKRDNQGAGVWKFSQTGEMVWKINKAIAAWCEEVQGSWVVIYLPVHWQMKNGWEREAQGDCSRPQQCGTLPELSCKISTWVIWTLGKPQLPNKFQFELYHFLKSWWQIRVNLKTGKRISRECEKSNWKNWDCRVDWHQSSGIKSKGICLGRHIRAGGTEHSSLHVYWPICLHYGLKL